MNHKQELAVHDAVSSTNKVSHLRMFLDTLYAYYSRSSDKFRRIERVCESLGTVINKIDKAFDVRWLFSSYRSVNAVYKSLPGLVGRLEIAATDSTLKKDSKGQRNG